MELTTLEDIEDAGGKIVSLKQRIEFILNRYAPSEFDAVKLRRLRSSLRSVKRRLKKRAPGVTANDVWKWQHEIDLVLSKYAPVQGDKDELQQLRAELKKATKQMKELNKHLPRLPAF